MAKTLVAQSIAGLNPLAFIMDGANVVGFTTNVEVNYGEIRFSHQLDLWPFLNPAQQQALQQFYNLLKQKVEAYYL